MTTYPLEQILLVMKNSLEGAQADLGGKLLKSAGNELSEEDLIAMLKGVNEKCIRYFDENTQGLFPKTGNFVEQYHESLIAMNSYHPLSLLYASKIREEDSPEEQWKDYQNSFTRGFRSLGLSSKTTLQILSKEEEAIKGILRG